MANSNAPGFFDRNHASRIFVDNNFGLSPKYGWLFHVAFDINSEIAKTNNDDLLRMGFVVKSASLPKFSVDTKTMNAYNRVDIVQTKVKYDSLTIKFHDDNLDVIRNFWYDYYSYYYRDSDWNPSIYAAPTKYSERQQQIWGYTPRQYPASSPGTQQFLTAIRIYSLHNKKFSEYTLINPTITSFKHGEHAQGGEAGTLEHEMTIAYQAVKYQYGNVTDDSVSGFAVLQYDNRDSPLGTSPRASGKVHDLSDGQTGLPGIINNIKNINPGAIVGGALSTIGSGLLSGALSGAIGKAAVAGGFGALASAAKAGLGKLTSNGSSIDNAKSLLGGSNLPNDPIGADPFPDIQSQLDEQNNQLIMNQIDAEAAQQRLDDNLSQQAQLQAQIEADSAALEDPSLSTEDAAALAQIIADNQSKLDGLVAEVDGIQTEIDNANLAADTNRAKIADLEEALNPSGNSPADGGPGDGSVTEVDPETGETITTNPDGSQTIVSADGSIYTVPQQNPVDNPNAATNQKSVEELKVGIAAGAPALQIPPNP